MTDISRKENTEITVKSIDIDTTENKTKRSYQTQATKFRETIETQQQF